MHRIFNWTFGSFFRTFGRFIFYILIGLLLSYLLKDFKLPKIDIFQVLNVYAYEIQTGNGDMVDDLKNIEFFNDNKLQGFSRIAVYNCTSNTSCTGSINYNQYSGGTVFNKTMANYGFDIAHDTNVILYSGHLYSYTYTVCFQNNVSNITNRLWVNSGLGTARGNEQTLLFYDYYYIGGSVDWYDYGIDGSPQVQTNSCYTVYNLFNNNGGTTSNIKINLKTSSFSNKYVNIVGYRLEDLGTTEYLTQNQLQSTINNSGLASASSVNQVQQSVNEVKTELNNVNSSIEEQTQQQQANHEETINTITDTSSPNLDGLNNSAGWLPAGPVDSILNLPLSLLNNLTTNLSANCQPVVLPLPYVNKNLELPCLNTIYSQIDGVSSWLNTIGTIASAFILFGYLINLYKYIDDTLTFRENNYIDNWSGV